MAKSRAYAFTLNNPTEDEFENIKKLKYKYMIVGDEIAPDTGTHHYQGYINFNSSTSFNTIKKAIPRAHIEPAYGSPRANYEYCSKQEIKYENGARPAPGKRTDIDNIKKYVQETENPNMVDIITNNTTNNQTIKYAENLLKYLEKGRTTRPVCLWYYGDTGTGKTHTAYEEHPDAYIKDNCLGGFFEGYDAHPVIIIDDMRIDTFKWNELLRLTDRYPNRVNVKGTSRQNLAHTIIVTSPKSPYEMFENKITENIEQLIRRFKEIRHFTEKYVEPEN
jgi:hypothetical protein